MKKILKSFKFYILLVFLLLIGGSYITHKLHRREVTQFISWKPRPKMVASQFIGDGKAVAIQWETKKELDKALDAQNDDREISVERPINGSHRGNYIAQVSYKLKTDVVTPGLDRKHKTLDGSRIDPISNRSNKPEKGEYWLIDIYDSKDNSIKKHTFDMFKIVRELNQKYIPLAEHTGTLYYDKDDQETYLSIGMLVGSKDKYVVQPGDIHVETEYNTQVGLMNVQTGTISLKTSSGKDYDQLRKDDEKNYKVSHPFESNPKNNFDSTISFYDSRLRYKIKDSENETIPLKSTYPKVYSILSKGHNEKIDGDYEKGEEAYLYFIGPEDLNFDISILELFYPKGGSDTFKLFYNYTIPAEYSKDGQEHVVKNKKSFSNISKRVPIRTKMRTRIL